MSLLPIQLNFFQKAERFFELQALDRQNDERMSQISQKGFTFPTWELEKKILRWTYLHHKHLGTPITKELLTNPNFLKDLDSNWGDVVLCGQKQILENLVIHGFAELKDIQNGSIIVNSIGLLTGSILYNSYRFEKKIYDDRQYRVLTPSKKSAIANRALYLSAWLIIFWTILLLILQLVNLMGLSDILKNLFNFRVWIKQVIIFLAFLPIVSLFLGLAFSFNWKKEYKKA